VTLRIIDKKSHQLRKSLKQRVRVLLTRNTGCNHFHRYQGVTISTASRMGKQGVTISTASRMGMQGVTISTASNMDNGHVGCIHFRRQQHGHAGCNHFHQQRYGCAWCIPFHHQKYCIDVQGVFISTLGSMDVQCYTFPSPEVHGCDDADRGQLSGLF
jgi:hypothetical protein